MILLQLKGEKVIGIYTNISPAYAPKENELLVDTLPMVEFGDDEILRFYYRNGVVEVVKEKRYDML